MKAKVGHASCSFFICSKCDKNDSPAWSWAVGRAHQLSSHPVKNKGRKRWKKQKHGITMNNTSTGHPQDEVAMASLVSTIIYMYHQLSSRISSYLYVTSSTKLIMALLARSGRATRTHRPQDSSASSTACDTEHRGRRIHRGPHRRRALAGLNSTLLASAYGKLKASSKQVQIC